MKLPFPTLQKRSAEDTKNSRNVSLHYIYMDNEDLSILSYPFDIKIDLSGCTHKKQYFFDD
jgi:YbbR domain-containing protein